MPHAAPVNQGLGDASKRSAKGSNKSPVVVDDLDKQPADAVPAHGIGQVQAERAVPSMPPQTTWEFGSGQGKVVIEKLSREKDRLRPI